MGEVGEIAEGAREPAWEKLFICFQTRAPRPPPPGECVIAWEYKSWAKLSGKRVDSKGQKFCDGRDAAGDGIVRRESSHMRAEWGPPLYLQVQKRNELAGAGVYVQKVRDLK